MRWGFAALACMSALLALMVFLTGGIALSVAGVPFRSSNLARPLLLAAIATAVYVWSSGIENARADMRTLGGWLTPRIVAGSCAAAVAVVGTASNSWTAGGPDAFCYVTQADLALAGRVSVAVSLAQEAPWPNAIASFTPFGYAPTHDGSAIAPITGPGLPWLMAGAKLAAGHAAAFLLVPLSGALLVWMTFAIGRRLVSDRVGAGAAWVIATSPTVLAMVKTPMSDVPAAATWAVTTLLLLRRTRRADLAAGVAAGLAVLIRPNLVPLAALAGAWVLFVRPSPRGSRATAALAVAAGAAPAWLALAAINRSLFGSPLSSGYGQPSDVFSLAHVGPNAVRYVTWLAETQTPLALAGLAALVLPARHLWPTVDGRRGARLLAGLVAIVVAIYLAYLPFEAWWFLRFLLPAWPAMAIGTATLVVCACRLKEDEPRTTAHETTGRRRTLASVLLIALGAYGLGATWHLDVFPGNEGERRYATIAQLVEQTTEPGAVVLTGMQAGPVRYYAGRLTMRFDALDQAWLDRAFAWWRVRGRHPYILLEDWEMPAFRARFGGNSRLGRLELAPVLAYRAHLISGTVYLFDPSRPDGPTSTPPPIRNPRPRSLLPSPRWIDP